LCAQNCLRYHAGFNLKKILVRGRQLAGRCRHEHACPCSALRQARPAAHITLLSPEKTRRAVAGPALSRRGACLFQIGSIWSVSFASLTKIFGSRRFSQFHASRHSRSAWPESEAHRFGRAGARAFAHSSAPATAGCRADAQAIHPENPAFDRGGRAGQRSFRPPPIIPTIIYI